MPGTTVPIGLLPHPPLRGTGCHTNMFLLKQSPVADASTSRLTVSYLLEHVSCDPSHVVTTTARFDWYLNLLSGQPAQRTHN